MPRRNAAAGERGGPGINERYAFGIELGLVSRVVRMAVFAEWRESLKRARITICIR